MCIQNLTLIMGMKVMVSWAFNGLFELLLLHSGIVSLLTYTPTNIWLNVLLQVLPKHFWYPSKMHLCIVLIFNLSLDSIPSYQFSSFPKGPALSSAAMSAKAISEQTGKELLYKNICTSAAVQNRFHYASVTAETDWARLTQDHSWLLTEVRLFLSSS